MSLEQMNKPDLVKLTRELQQELKQLKAEKKAQDELNSETSSDTQGEVELPYQVAAAIKVSANRSKLYVIDFNLEGQCVARESPIGPQEHYKVQHKVDQFTANISFRKNVLKVKDKVETTQETNEGETDGN